VWTVACTVRLTKSRTTAAKVAPGSSREVASYMALIVGMLFAGRACGALMHYYGRSPPDHESHANPRFGR
jgi:hypothetical protein